MDVLMPQLGETVAEGKIVKWFKQAGDAVKPGENLFEIETDKTSMEVPSIAGGTLTDIRFGVGEVAKVGAVVAIIAGAGEVSAPKAAAVAVTASPSPLAPAKAGVQKSQTRKELDPRFRGDDRGVGLGNERSNWQASRDFSYADMSPWREVRTPERNYGPAKLSTGNFVTPLARRLASERGIDLTRVAGSGPHGRIVAADIDQAPRADAPSQTVSQFYLVADVEIGRLQPMLSEAKSAGAELSIADFAIKAWAVALKRVMPNAGADIGFIQSVDGRRVTRVVRDAGDKSLTAIAKEAREQDGAAPDARTTSAIHVLATPGIREFAAVVAPPFASVLAIGQPRRAPIENDDGGIKFIGLMTVTLSCDHRAVDTALAADLLTTFKSLVETPVAALV